eukprot:gnl/TRDRNA2_/TRDRNA2_168577_c2_seq6.p1 gnl/TRDRNA2_/TRDRNA2_168577_c2~~gnl/TRDRNA2_/TRDRNA2_168577_c2_seq6.p1  ORF type:complete len:313 (+),score=45.60 gnl/TRDRNA2_/TRDRNA2_168577_c2_seq6:126-1064(+)
MWWQKVELEEMPKQWQPRGTSPPAKSRVRFDHATTPESRAAVGAESLCRPREVMTVGRVPAPGGGSSLGLTRPQSAPTLLRNEGLLDKQTHNSDFLQKLENVEVKDCLQSLRRERYPKRDFIRSINCMKDHSLYDLKVKHNACQRARSATSHQALLDVASGPKGANRSRSQAHGRDKNWNWEELSPSQRMRKLCHALESDMRYHCNRIDAPQELRPVRPEDLLRKKGTRALEDLLKGTGQGTMSLKLGGFGADKAKAEGVATEELGMYPEEGTAHGASSPHASLSRRPSRREIENGQQEDSKDGEEPPCNVQ